ncbi:MAG: NAD/NADP octopine/nopaline dehydrogenase family protein [Coprothermobacterota bacterium]|jgi:opine dehydrogenase|nr:NAD/NADP octopine/nopaline dehydrogenase family protein [Coprothermobacterota bacterium]
MKKPKFCVLGAGNGGLAMAAHLVLKGYEVNLYNRSQPRLNPVIARGGIEVTGQVQGFAPISIATTNPEEAIKGVDVLMVVVPANGHAFIAQKVAPYLEDGQIILLNPGRTCGAIEFRNVLKEEGCRADVIVAEAQTFIYASRALNPAQVHIYRIKNSIPVAALPNTDTNQALQLIRQAFPEFVKGENVLKTSLDNIGSVFHPTLTILNAARIENERGEFQYYIEGNSPTTSRILEAVDRERLEVAKALKVQAISAVEWLEVAYDATGSNLYEAMQNNQGYYGINAPSTLQTRYLSEDVPMSLVPIASLGEKFGVPVPTIQALIHLASVLHQTDYWAQGRTVEKLGIQDLTADQLHDLVESGGFW